MEESCLTAQTQPYIHISDSDKVYEAEESRNDVADLLFCATINQDGSTVDVFTTIRVFPHSPAEFACKCTGPS
jgi:hypothetical protein